MRIGRHRAGVTSDAQRTPIGTALGPIPVWVPPVVARRAKTLTDALPPRALALVAWAREIAQASVSHRSALVAGGLAFFVLLAIAPAAIVVGALVGIVLSPSELAQLTGDLTRVTPEGAAQLTPYSQALIAIAQASSGMAFSIASCIGVLVAVYAASRFLYGLRLAMQGTFHTAAEERTRTSRLAATLATALGLLVVSAAIVLLAVVQPLMDSIGVRALDIIGTHRWMWWVVIALGVLLAIRRTYRRLPGKGRRLAWRAPGVWLATGWILAVSAGVGVYASRSSTLGAAVAVFGAPIVLMLWLYLCFIGLLLGAEIEAARERRAIPAGSDAGEGVEHASGGPAGGGTP